MKNILPYTSHDHYYANDGLYSVDNESKVIFINMGCLIMQKIMRVLTV